VGDRWGTGRTEAFSDGVFAIAITLLILEVGVPESEFDNLWRGTGHQWPSYLAYATSFITIGGLWMVHHGIFRRLQYANAAVMRLSRTVEDDGGTLGVRVADRLGQEFGGEGQKRDGHQQRQVLLVISLLISALWGTIARNRHLLRPEVSEQEINKLLVAATPNLGFYVGVIVLAFVAPKVAAFGYLVIAIVAVLRVRGDQTTPNEMAEST
jgi:hypothetical protein